MLYDRFLVVRRLYTSCQGKLFTLLQKDSVRVNLIHKRSVHKRSVHKRSVRVHQTNNSVTTEL